MALSHSLGFPRVGRDCALHGTSGANWNAGPDEAELRAERWQLQKDAGLVLLPVGDYAWYDQVLAHSLAFGVIPEGQSNLTSKAAVDADGRAQAQGAWFAAHYPVPEFTEEQPFTLNWEALFDEVAAAQALGHNVKPVLIGPLTYLWLGQAKGGDFERLDLLERLLPVYGEIFQRLGALGVEWVQIDEPILVLDLPQAWKNAFERAYNLIQREPCRKLVASYCGSLEDNLGLAANLPVDGLHVDLLHAPERLTSILDRLPAYKVLSLGVVNGRDDRRCEPMLERLRDAHERLGERLWLAPSSPLQHGPADAAALDSLASAVQTCRDVARLGQALTAPDDDHVQAVGLARQSLAEPA